MPGRRPPRRRTSISCGVRAVRLDRENRELWRGRRWERSNIHLTSSPAREPAPGIGKRDNIEFVPMMTTATATSHIHADIRNNPLQKGLALWYASFWLLTGLAPFDRRDWLLENFLVVALAGLL